MTSRVKQDDLLLHFQDMDVDKNGFLTKSEVSTCLHDLGFDKGFIKLFMKKFDRNGDGVITYDEYKGALGLVEETQERSASLRQVFHEIDKDNSGKISCRELLHLMREMRFDCQMSDLETWLRQNGLNPDSDLDYETFLNLMSSQ